jgi:hypothetical protein
MTQIEWFSWLLAIVIVFSVILSLILDGCITYDEGLLTPSMISDINGETPLIPGRPPLPCGWYVLNDSTYGYNAERDTCK